MSNSSDDAGRTRSVRMSSVKDSLKAVGGPESEDPLLAEKDIPSSRRLPSSISKSNLNMTFKLEILAVSSSS